MSNKVQYQQKPNTNTSQGPNTQQPTTTQQDKKTYQNKRYQHNPYQRKSKYQDKSHQYTNKYGFDYDQRKISYNTQIPQMPQKLKAKPDQTKLNKKVDQLQNKVKQLKKLRKQKKDNYKNGSKTFTDQIQNQKKNIDLAKACLVVLNYDKKNLETDINDVENKINQHKKKIDFINRPSQKSTKTSKIQEMNFQELVKQEDRITHEMSTKNLSKAQEVELSNKLNKIKKRKVEIPKENVSTVHQHDEKFDEIQSHKNAIEKLRHIRQTLADKSTDLDNKIESVEEDIQDFEDKIEEIHDKLRNTDNSKLLQEAAQLKQQIIAIWDQIHQLQEQHKAKVSEYEQQQQKIKYIEWAKGIKAKKAEEWQAEKQQRKKQKLRQKEKQKKGDQKPTKQGEKKQGQKTQQEKPAFERKKINRNQKQIDSCAFLIQYCKDLSSNSDKTEGQSTSQKEVKLEQALKKGEWAKQKNVEIIQSKKKRAQVQPETKTFKKKENKVVSQEPVDRFSHTYFVAQVFDSMKVLPPTKPEDLEKVINELEDKMEYYIAHPDEEVGKSLLPSKESDRDTKGRGPRKIINTEEFPSLR